MSLWMASFCAFNEGAVDNEKNKIAAIIAEHPGPLSWTDCFIMAASPHPTVPE
jgi:hypothetical protein